MKSINVLKFVTNGVLNESAFVAAGRQQLAQLQEEKGPMMAQVESLIDEAFDKFLEMNKAPTIDEVLWEVDSQVGNVSLHSEFKKHLANDKQFISTRGRAPWIARKSDYAHYVEQKAVETAAKEEAEKAAKLAAKSAK